MTEIRNVEDAARQALAAGATPTELRRAVAVAVTEQRNAEAARLAALPHCRIVTMAQIHEQGGRLDAGYYIANEIGTPFPPAAVFGRPPDPAG